MNKEKKPTFTVTLDKGPFNEIILDPAILPDIIDKKEFKPDSSLKKSFQELMAETGYIAPLKVGQVNGRKYLLPPYENYQAHAHHVAKDTSQLVNYITVHAHDEKDLAYLSCRLSHFDSTVKSHIKRLAIIDLIWADKKKDPNMKKLRKSLNISETNSTGKRQLQYDIRLLKQREALSHTIGVNLCDENGKDLSIIEAIYHPRNEVDIFFNASQAEKLIARAKNNTKVIKKVIEAYKQESKRLNKYYANKENEGKPIYQWKPYFSFQKMLEITDNLSEGVGYLTKANDEEMRDFSWGIKIDTDTGEYIIPEVKGNMDSGSPEELKKIIEVAFKATTLSGTFLGHIDRIKPLKHGEGPKVDRENLKPNKPKFDDSSYAKNFIRTKKILLFSNRRRTLECLKLKPQYFGFNSSDWDEKSTYYEARKRFENWWASKFMKEIQNWYGNKKTSHPSAKVYVYIRAFLNMMAKPTFDKDGNEIKPAQRLVFFHEFYNEMFSYVFQHMDDDAEKQEMRVKTLLGIERNLIGNSWSQLDEALDKTGKVTLNREQLETVLQERQNAMENNLAIVIKQNEELLQALEEVIYNPLKTNQDRNVTKLIKLKT